MEKIPDNKREAVPFLLFRVRRHLCALPLTVVVETMRPLPVEAIMGAPAAVKGLAVIRGVPLPVVDLGALLGGGDEPPTRFVTVRTGERRLALAIESVIGLRYLSADTLRDIPPLLNVADESVVSTVGTLDAELLVVLNAAHLVPESVWQAINGSGETS